MIYLWVGLGSALGGMARYWCYEFLARTAGETFPWVTFAVNNVAHAPGAPRSQSCERKPRAEEQIPKHGTAPAPSA